VMATVLEAKAAKQYELAYSVSDRVQINNVILADCQAARGGGISSAPAELRGATIVSGVSHAESIENKQLHIMISFVLQNVQASENDQLVIRASFVLLYSVSSFDGIDDEHIEAFAAINGVFNAWPYWREFVQNTTSRMGLAKPIVIPVFRLGHAEDPEQAEGSL
jgi:hypothetical protein